MLRQVALMSSAGLLLVGCAARPPVVAVAPPPVVVTAPAAAMPAGGYPGMKIPTALADGSYPTPNRALTPAATVWHLRVALNVAALACRGTQGDALVAGYNTLIATQKTVLARAESDYAAQMRAGGGDWRDRYDDAMTRLYNFFSQSPARPQFCAAATRVLADATSVPADGWAGFAAARLPELDAPFTDFYRAYDAWAAGRPAVQPPVQMAAVRPALAPPVQVIALAAAPSATAVAPAAPWIEVDPAVFALP